MKNSSDIKILVYTYLYVHKKLININSYGIKLYVINLVKKFRNIQKKIFYIFICNVIKICIALKNTLHFLT